MKSQNIVFTKENIAELITEKVEMPKKDEVLVKLCVSTVSSGTERANLVGSKTVSPFLKEQEVAVFPRRCGYSSAGIVEKVGKNVTDLQVGDRVALAWSTHSQYVTIKSSNVYKIGDIPFEDAAMFTISTFPLAAISIPLALLLNTLLFSKIKSQLQVRSSTSSPTLIFSVPPSI